MQVKPLSDRVLVERLEEERKQQRESSSPIAILRSRLKEKSFQLAPGRTLDNGTVQALQVKEGDKILFGKYAGTEVKVEGRDYLIMREDDILGVLQ